MKFFIILTPRFFKNLDISCLIHYKSSGVEYYKCLYKFRQLANFGLISLKGFGHICVFCISKKIRFNDFCDSELCI